MVVALSFFLGLGIGLLLLVRQRLRADSRLKALARSLGSEKTSLSSTSQLGIAIAHRQELQHGLEQQIENYQQILQVAPIGYLQVDDENRLVDSNVQARSLLGISEELSVAKPRLLLELARSYELDDLIDQARHTNRLCQSDWTFYSVSRDPVQLSEQQSYAMRGYAFPLIGRQVGIFLENRQESLTLTQQRDRWTSDLAHELKTPLTSIRLVAETLQTRVDPTLRNWIDRLIQETIRLSKLVQDLLDLSQIDRTSFQGLQLQTTDLVALIHAVWNSLEPLTRQKGLQLDYSGPAQFQMPLDAARIHRLLVNLLDNSIKFSAPQQPISVQVQVEDDAVGLDVIDRGSGFPEAALPHVFERFYRADPSRSRIPNEGSQPDFVPGGSGLGLAIARQIVEMHQGTISASNHPDGGAWLQVKLPIRAERT
jgi:two-component system, OmpR family, phosphate regulon sensor histidine kinase PhoR